VQGSTLEDLVFHLKLPVLTPQLSEFFLLRARQPRRVAAVLVDIGLGHPVPQTGLADTQILRQLGDRFGLLTSQLDGTTTELRRVWPRWQLGGERGRVSTVRATGHRTGVIGSGYEGQQAE
jgi:hypothetical protein